MTRQAILFISLLIVTSMSNGYASKNFRFNDNWATDFNKKIVDLSEIESGGPPKDGIPAIDHPKFVSIEQARSWLNPKEPVIVVTINQHTRAYPIQVLMFHEIVNDIVDSIPLVITFCPLCNAALVYERTLNGKILDFGTTGNLRMSDLIMYDRQTESWWQQFTGEGIIGHYTGKTLVERHAAIIAFQEFAKYHPSGKVLSRETGYDRPYGNNPYRGYDNIQQKPFLFSGVLDKRLPPMERVLAISLNDKNKLYPFELISQHRVINDDVAKHAIVIFSQQDMLSPLDAAKISDSKIIPSAIAYSRQLDQQTLTFKQKTKGIIDTNTESSWNIFGLAIAGPLIGKQLRALPGGVHFAFAWLAFKPNSEIYVGD